jgi:hypothetical protein
MITTQTFKRLPSDSGVTFEGFEDIKLRSREEVRKKLEEFINYCKEARKPAIRIILGEWGEGKTDAFKRYIEPRAKIEGNYAFLISTSTLINGYESPSIQELLKSTSLSAAKFLVVLFNAIREECGEERIPDPRNYRDALNYLNTVLNNLIGKNKSRKIFIFIDEFEELLLYPQRLRDIISGIKETINGMYKMIDEGGEYEGCLHLIIAATPDAYYKLQTTEDFSLIFGGLGRRAGRIDLPQIQKEEGITFLFELLKYAYRGELPQPLPINNLGIFNTIFRIAQGNPGALVSLFTRLMNSAKINEKFIRVIDYEHLLKFLEKEHIFVYGGSTACLAKETFHRLLKVVENQSKKELGEKCITLLKMLVGELKPFSINELEERIKHSNVTNLIAIVNDMLRKKEGIERAILRVRPLRPDKTFHDVERAFKDFIIERDDGKYIQIDSYSEKLSVFEDRISYFTYKDNSIVREIYLPYDEQSVMSFFEGITSDRVVELENIIKRLCKDEDYYIVSDVLLSQIYPTPVPRELEFIKDREMRLRIWRDVTKNLAREYEINMPQAFIHVLGRSKVFSVIEKGHVQKHDGLSACIAELKVEEVKINTLLFPVNGDVRGEDVEELWSIMRGRKPPIHCVLLIYTGELTSEAEEKIENKGIGKKGENIILRIHIHPTLIKRIICIYKASFMSAEKVDEKLLSSIINKIVIQELNLPDKIKNWLKEQEEKGAVVKLRISSTGNLGEFADTLKFFINFMDQEETTKGVFDKNQKLLGYVRYGAKKVGLIPDIQFPKFNEIVKDLSDNGFLIRLEEGKYRLQLHPVEKRILKILRGESKIPLKDLEEYFILGDTRYLREVFLPILEYKGLITREDKYISLTNRNELYSTVKGYYDRFIEEAKQYQDYGYVYMVKERGERSIFLTELSSFIHDLYKQVQKVSGLDDQLELQKLSLMRRLLEHFFEELLPLIKKASEKSNEIRFKAKGYQIDIKKLIDEIKEKCDKWFKLQFEAEGIEEYKLIQKFLKEIEEIHSLTHEEVKKVIKELKEDEKEKFRFNMAEEEAFYFNPKLYKISALYDDIDKKRKDVEEAVEELKKQFNSLEEKQKKIESELKKRDVPEEYKISHSMLEMLKQLNKDVIPQAQPYKIERLKMKDISEYVQQNLEIVNSSLNHLEKCIDTLDELYKTEEEFVNSLKEAIPLSSHLCSIFDIDEYSSIAEKFFHHIVNIVSQYKEHSQNIRLGEPKLLLEKMEELKEIIEELKGKLISERGLVYSKWKEYVDETKDFISNIKRTMEVLQRFIINVRKIKEIEEELNNIQNYINIKDIKELNLRLSELERRKQNVHDMLYETLKDLLTREEFLLIEYIVEKTKGKRKERSWIPLEEIYEFAEKKLHLDRPKILTSLEKLLDLKILKEGVTLVT